MLFHLLVPSGCLCSLSCVLPLLCSLSLSLSPPVFGEEYTLPLCLPLSNLPSVSVRMLSQFGLVYSITSCHLWTFSLQLHLSLGLPVMHIFECHTTSSSCGSNKEFSRFCSPELLSKFLKHSSTCFPSLTPLTWTACTNK